MSLARTRARTAAAAAAAASAALIALVPTPTVYAQQPTDRPVIRSQADLPRHEYVLPDGVTSASGLLRDPDALLTMLPQLKADVEQTLATYDIADAAVRRGFHLTTVRIYASGYRVESYVPGGTRLTLSGTSMAAPQVARLAGQLLAIAPHLTTADVKRLILEGGDSSTHGRLLLLNPARSVALLREGVGR